MSAKKLKGIAHFCVFGSTTQIQLQTILIGVPNLTVVYVPRLKRGYASFRMCHAAFIWRVAEFEV